MYFPILDNPINQPLEGLSFRKLRDLFTKLKKDSFWQLQTIPFSNHTSKFQNRNLEFLREKEKKTLEKSVKGYPVIYNYSLDNQFYKDLFKVSERQLLIGDVFLFNSTTLYQARETLKDYCELLESDYDIEDRFPFRVVPVFDLLLLADHLDRPNYDTVHLFTDSLALATYLREKHPHERVSDLGTGSGVLALVLSMVTEKKVLAVDINKRAVQVALYNILLNQRSNIELRWGDIQAIEETYPIVVSNPPYMEKGSIAHQGGKNFGMELPLSWVDFLIERKKKLIFILEAPVSKNGNLFDNMLDDRGYKKEKTTLDLWALDETVLSHQSFSKAGFLAKEKAIYEIE